MVDHLLRESRNGLLEFEGREMAGQPHTLPCSTPRYVRASDDGVEGREWKRELCSVCRLVCGCVYSARGRYEEVEGSGGGRVEGGSGGRDAVSGCLRGIGAPHCWVPLVIKASGGRERAYLPCVSQKKRAGGGRKEGEMWIERSRARERERGGEEKEGE